MTKAENTRLTILQKAFGLIYRNGYQGTSIDDILVDSPVTKGAFFYHFKNKEQMGLAMIKEIMYPGMYEVMIKPLIGSVNPVKEIHLMMTHLLMTAPFFESKYGCPAVNLIEEMAPLNTAFHKALGQLINEWQKAMEDSLSKAKSGGHLHANADPKQIACFIAAGYSGIRNMGKLLGTDCYISYLLELRNYLDGIN